VETPAPRKGNGKRFVFVRKKTEKEGGPRPMGHQQTVVGGGGGVVLLKERDLGGKKRIRLLLFPCRPGVEDRSKRKSPLDGPRLRLTQTNKRRVMYSPLWRHEDQQPICCTRNDGDTLHTEGTASAAHLSDFFRTDLCRCRTQINELGEGQGEERPPVSS